MFLKKKKNKFIYLPWMLAVADFDAAFAKNVKFIAYVLPLRNLHGAASQPVTWKFWMVPNSDPQSLNGVAVHIELNEQDKIVRMNNVNMIFFCLKIGVFEQNVKCKTIKKVAEVFYL